MATPKRKPVATHLHIVGPNLEEMERNLTEYAAQQAPMIKRSSSAKAKFETELKALEGERAAVEDRISLVQKHYEALMQGFNAELADIDRACGLYTGGLTGDVLAAAE